jgi:2-polyprenyl-3-methyl-5-hydroxy-6-metoxy-1,4-benzoquinol methylase
MLTDEQDAFGHEMYDYYKEAATPHGIREIVERDDGYIEATVGPAVYFNEYKKWPGHERKAMRYARGRVLDIGCGAGRCALYLQGKGLDVMGIDNSPLTIEVCKLRGLKRTSVTPINQISAGLGRFDTVLMMGNNFGLFGSYDAARRLLKKLAKITSENGRIIAETSDIYKTDNPDHLAYHEFNRKRGRMSGQIRIRVRYKKHASLYFDYLMVSKNEMKDILEGTEWEIKRFIDSAGPVYITIIDKKKDKK